MICGIDDPCVVCYEFEAQINVLELPEHKSIMSSGYTCVLHMHTTVEEIEIAVVVGVYDKDNKRYLKTSFLKSFMQGIVRLKVRNHFNFI